jgi:small subunit ribosomal protein MRP21
MSLPNSILNPSSVSRPNEAALLAQQQEDTFSNYPRLNPTYGKQVELNPARGRDLVRGIGMLSSLVIRNQVRKLQIKQKFHERPGLKRKRLVSERWRKRFKKGFHQMTSRVSELTKKGW